MEFAGSLTVKDLVLSLLSLRFDPWPGNAACHRPAKKKNKQTKKKPTKKQKNPQNFMKEIFKHIFIQVKGYYKPLSSTSRPIFNNCNIFFYLVHIPFYLII